MIRRRIGYLLLLAAGIYFMLLYDFQGLRFLFGCALCIPVFSFLGMLPGFAMCRAGMRLEQDAVTRGETAVVSITVENKSPFPVSRILVILRWKAPGEREIKIRKWLCGMGGHRREKIVLELSAAHCGRGRLMLSRTCVYDWLGLVSLWAGKRRGEEFCVLPVIKPIPLMVQEAYSSYFQGSGEEREGDLLLRDFLPGDSLHRIYWKLAAKAEELQVRDFEKSGSLTLFLNFSEQFRERAEAWDEYLDRACSLLYFFAEECERTGQIVLQVAWSKKGRFLGYEIPGSGNVQVWIYGLLKEEALGRFLTQEEISYLGNGCHLEEDGRLYFGEQCVYEE